MINKKLAAALALTFVMSTGGACFAADASTSTGTSQSTTDVSNPSTVNLTLDDALNSIEKNNRSIGLLDQQIDLCNKQYDSAHSNSLGLQASNLNQATAGNQYAALKIQEDVVPQQAALAIEDAKHKRNNTLKTLKFTTEQQYMAVVNLKSQIENINETIANVNDQIKDTTLKIQQGLLTQDALNALEVQKSQLEASLNTPKSQMQQALLGIKQALNLDLNTNLVLAPAQRDFAKYDDSDISDKITKSVADNYDLYSLQKNIDFMAMEQDIYSKYYHNDNSNEVQAGLNVQNLKNQLDETKLNKTITLWNSYYDLKNKEDAVQTVQATVDADQASYNSTEAKLNQGIVTKLELDSAQLTLNKDKLNLEMAVNDYMVAVDTYEYNLSNE
ncbi:TolC family protein [Clostridium fermenticellae]|uniref:TolC family protein n=1 Tax=Clostridium fermenticellae TaxID=2068654 RepID=A0A386H182_9CLOT|nr:TolC family protein [Clostridium fermenticellae]AYD39323.1 TolC family protein [Clostridium fermenticellae]